MTPLMMSGFELPMTLTSGRCLMAEVEDRKKYSSCRCRRRNGIAFGRPGR